MPQTSFIPPLKFSKLIIMTSFAYVSKEWECGDTGDNEKLLLRKDV